MMNMVSDAMLVRLLLGERRQSDHLKKLEELGVTLDSEVLLPEVAPVVIEILGATEDQVGASVEVLGQPTGLTIDLVSDLVVDLLHHEPTEEGMTAFLQHARERIAAAREA